MTKKWPLFELIHFKSRRSISSSFYIFSYIYPLSHIQGWTYLAQKQIFTFLKPTAAISSHRQRRVCFYVPNGTDVEKKFFLMLFGIFKNPYALLESFFMLFSIFKNPYDLPIQYNSSSEAVLNCYRRLVLSVINDIQSPKLKKRLQKSLSKRAPASKLQKPKKSKGVYYWVILSVITDSDVQAILNQGCLQTVYAYHIPVDYILWKTAIVVPFSPI